MTENNKRNRRERGRERTKPDKVMLILGGAFILSALVTAFFAFRFVRGIIRETDIFQLGGLAVQPPAADDTGDDQTASAEVNTGSLNVEVEQINFSDRINFLLMGLDYRDWGADQGSPARSDTMIVFTIDPVSKTAAMLSVPRDLWVNVPGYGQNKINTAYFLGEANRLPGGGPELAAKTVEEFLGIDIHYWAQVDFTAFVQFVDYIGGVKLNIQEPITLELIGTDKKETLQPGRQTLSGAIALAYARNRYEGDGDFSRAQRQQEVIMAIRNQLVRRDVQKM
ncbi:MAG: LCP family protein, partial [Anaerolineales bacterium]